MQPVRELVERLAWADRHHLDGAVGHVAHPTGQVKIQRRLAGIVSKTYALNMPVNNCVKLWHDLTNL